MQSSENKREGHTPYIQTVIIQSPVLLHKYTVKITSVLGWRRTFEEPYWPFPCHPGLDLLHDVWLVYHADAGSPGQSQHGQDLPSEKGKYFPV